MRIIKTKYFILRPFGKSDEHALAENLNHKVYSRNIPSIPYPYKLKDAREWIRKILKEYKKKKPEQISFSIEINKNLAGAITLANIEANHKAEVGYWLSKKYWGQGLIPKALKEITKVGFEKLKLKRIYAKTLSHNKPSRRVLEKCGYKFEGTAKKDCKIGNKFIDNHFFAKVK